ncbi:CNGA3-like protein [Mya arenaria]|uniref:CNGA3-like protein n=1 Tax=Mya arenaria TaxID=6604 RepID=A0ABY7DNY9_MYAAR|nr:CNGA3-like protein [Mya arenaria]
MESRAKKNEILLRQFTTPPQRNIQTKKKTEVECFLERFTVTGRSFSAENEAPVYHFKDIFKPKFWKEVTIDPSGTSYYYFSLALMLCVLYNLLIIILRCVFPQPHESYLIVFLTIDYFCDVVYLIDMFCTSRIGFLEQGLLVRDVPRLRKRYMNSWKFMSDICSLVPFDLVYLAIGVRAYLRFNRLVKIWRFKQFFHMAETHTNYPNLIRVSNLILYIIIIIHWFGCIYFFISSIIGFGSDDWVYKDPAVNPGFEKFWQQYSVSFYWATLTLTTIGDTEYPVTPEETWFCILCSLMGVLIFATIFGNVGAMINHMDASRTEFQNKVDNVKRYMDLRGISPDLQERVVKWFDYTWNNKQSIDDKEALMFLPEKLRAELSIHVHMFTLKRVAIFQDCEPGLLVELVLKLKLQVYSPGDFICKKGDIGKEMYIIKRGKLQVVSEDGTKVFVTLSDGAVFGEISVLNIAGNKTGNRRTASVKTVGYSDLFCLTKNDLWEALEEYPDAKKMLLEKGKQLLRKDKLLDEEAAIREEKKQQALVSKIEMIVDAVDDIQKRIETLSEKVDRNAAPFSRSRSLTMMDMGRTAPITPVETPEVSPSQHKPPSPIPEEDETPGKDKNKENDDVKKQTKTEKPADSAKPKPDSK